MTTRTLATYVGDMHALEAHVIEPFERQLGITKDFTSAHWVVQQLIKTCNDHIPILSARLSQFGNTEKMITDKVKTVIAGVFGYAAGLIDLLRPMAASKALRDSYTAIHMLIVGYMMLQTTAAALGDTNTEQLAERFLNEWIFNGKLVLSIIPDLVMKDLKDDGVPIENLDAPNKILGTKEYSSLLPENGLTEIQQGSSAL